MDAVAPVADPVAALSSALSLSQYQGGLTIVVDQTTVAAYHQSWLISLEEETGGGTYRWIISRSISLETSHIGNLIRIFPISRSSSVGNDLGRVQIDDGSIGRRHIGSGMSDQRRESEEERCGVHSTH
jgi:hypothetical protein